MKKSIFLFIPIYLFLSVLSSFADELPVIDAGVPSPTATLGDEIPLMLRVQAPAGYKITPPSPKLDLSPFELKRIETTPGGFLLVLTVFQLGETAIPPVPIKISDVSGKAGLLVSRPVPIKIVPVAEHPKENDQIKPIKGPVSIVSLFWRYFAGAVLLAALLAAAFIFWKRKRAVDEEALKPAHERALIELERLKKKGYLAEGKEKEYYSEFADVLRRYLERRYGTDALERTTAEILAALKSKDLDSDTTARIREILENADLVKFAKYKPEWALVGRLETDLVDVVNATKLIEEPPKESRAR